MSQYSPPPANQWQPQANYPPPPGFASPNYPGYQIYNSQPRSEPAAFGALICSFASYLLPLAPAVVTIVMAVMALRNISESKGTRNGKGLAISAIVLASLNLLILAGVVTLITIKAR